MDADQGIVPSSRLPIQPIRYKQPEEKNESTRYK